MTVESFYAQMLLYLQARITAQVPGIRYVDQDFGQLENYEGERPPVSFPCVLIDFGGTKFNQLSQLVEEGDAAINVRIGFAPFSSSNSLAPEQVREKALQYYELENSVYKALKGWAPQVDDDTILCAPLNRVADGTEGRNDKLRVRQMVFTTAFEDDGAMPVRQTVRPALSVEVD